MSVVPQGTLSTEVSVINWNVLVDAINANTAGIPATLATFTDGDTTPSVTGASTFRATNTGATSITTFDDGTDGQEIKILIDNGNTTFVDGATLKLNAGADLTPSQYDIIKFTLNSTVWCCSGYQQNTA